MRSAAIILAAALSAAAAFTTLQGCSKEPKKSAAIAPAEQVYTVRGRIAALPVAGQPLTSLNIAHEAVPSFVNKDGKVVGMNAMVMPFTPAPGLSLEGLAVGDPIEFVFEMRWTSKPRSQVTKITKLPPDTVLTLPNPGH